MAATNPSYYQSGVCQNIRQKEHRLHLYMKQLGVGTEGANENVVVPGLHGWGAIAVDDFSIHDGPPAANANIVARARGMHVNNGPNGDNNWLFCHNILFRDTRFKGSSLQMRGDFSYENDAEWAIVGGTGEFAHAHGVVTAKVIQPHTAATGRIWELDIHAFSLCISGTTKLGPWGGQGGTAFDIPEPPLSLQTVTIGYGDVINCIAFSYTDQAGQKKTAGPWGGSDGALTKTIAIAPSEIIKHVFGTTCTVGGDTVVTSLTLVSNLAIYGPFGKANGTPFCSQVPDCKIVAGFYARAGASVQALGVYYA